MNNIRDNISISNNNDLSNLDKELQQRIKHILAHVQQVNAWYMDLHGDKWQGALQRLEGRPLATRNKRSLQREEVAQYIDRLTAYRSTMATEHTAAQEDIGDFEEWVEGGIWNEKEQRHINDVLELTEGLEKEVRELLGVAHALILRATEYRQALLAENSTQENAGKNVNARHLMQPWARLAPEPKQAFKHAQRHKNFMTRRHNASKGGKRRSTKGRTRRI